ncbi:MAG: zinc metallopeptidase [Gammaproteobacteria bacterium]|nr:zinc metallopeptidase [Gammaproteobacteria bacterium]MDH3372798.1 zinc metallopeptidase [Gammaproteobacteria bacterium]MDH3410595.1 zinc metallopeptidase [Gammaproteobacteria bacterium]MDH3554034.1 zinc metallopeptidase [Gammaproteobacteria bacterium]
MKWRSGRRSSNIEDRRGASPRGLVGGGIGTIVIILAALYFGIDPSFLIEGMQSSTVSTSSSGTRPSAEDLKNDPLADMVSVVIADTEDVWHEIFKGMGRRYEEPTLVMFTGATRSACGTGQAAMGPFYCPADRKAYIDLSFYDDMRSRFRAPGDFAQAYVIAHEVGHHVQNLLGISTQVRRMQSAMSKADANRLSVKLELQADCLAGVWANRADRARGILEAGDVDEALNAASAIGDDRLQKQSRGMVVPESFTHGTSAQRQRWFRAGLSSGDPDRCDTFAAAAL